MNNVNEAVKTIKDYCESFKECLHGCCFYDEKDGCTLKRTPEEWEVSA